MTLSIATRCADTGMLGLAAITGTAGVGKLLTWAEADVGAVATQSWINPYLGIDGLALLRIGHRAEQALAAILSLDEDADLRQVGMVDRFGGTAAHTGGGCSAWAGHLTGSGFAVQGNLLVSAEPVEAAAGTLTDARGPLVDRLVAALQAAVAAGGDRRGHRSATVLVVNTEHYPLWDVRVDDHDDPLDELCRLIARFEETLIPQIRKLPTRMDPRGDLDPRRSDGLV